MTTSAQDASFISSLVAQVKRHDGRARLAALRRAVGKPPGSVAETDRIVFSAVPSGASQSDVNRYHLVATLFGLWQQGRDSDNIVEGRGSLGSALRILRDKKRKRVGGRTAEAEREDPVERRFMAVINAHRDDLPGHLQRLVAQLASESVPVNWLGLLRDLRLWDSEERWVQRRWAQDFWGSVVDSSAAQPADEGNSLSKDQEEELSDAG